MGFGDSWSRGGGDGGVIRKMFEKWRGMGGPVGGFGVGLGRWVREYHAMEAVGCLIHLPRFDEADGGRGGGVWSGADEDGEVRI